MSRVLPKHAKLDRFGLRLDSIESHAAAFYARPQGATQAEITRELGVFPNVISKLIKKGYYFKAVGEIDGRLRYFLNPLSTRNKGRKPKP